MSATHGQRKAALYLASLSPRDQQALLAQLPPATTRLLQPLSADLARRGWDERDLVHRVLAEDLQGLSAHGLDIEALLSLTTTLPADWSARLLAANGSVDPAFMLALLEDASAARVKAHLARAPRIPEALRAALVAEAQASVPPEH